jgi:hypothetical protein
MENIVFLLIHQTFGLSLHLLPNNFRLKYKKSVILPVALYGCKTWSLTQREYHRLKVFESSIPRRIFEPKRKEV